MSDSSARQFVFAYAILLALVDLSVLLPGNPYTSVRGFVVSVGIQALVAWRLWHRSSLAWLVAMLFAAGTVVSLVLMQPPLDAGVILMFVFSVVQVLILWVYALSGPRPLSGPVGTPAEALRQ
ncbi:MAG TPA: hypothetical protein VKA24_05845 [Gaiellaceae bacterium]|nr:hypothetical protein [Gaiellaceae bacterium]